MTEALRTQYRVECTLCDWHGTNLQTIRGACPECHGTTVWAQDVLTLPWRSSHAKDVATPKDA